MFPDAPPLYCLLSDDIGEPKERAGRRALREHRSALEERAVCYVEHPRRCVLASATHLYARRAEAMVN